MRGEQRAPAPAATRCSNLLEGSLVERGKQRMECMSGSSNDYRDSLAADSREADPPRLVIIRELIPQARRTPPAPSPERSGSPARNTRERKTNDRRSELRSRARGPSATDSGG